MSNLRAWYVHTIFLPRGSITLENPQDSFDVRKFLRSELEELPPMPNPVVVTEEGKPRFKGVR